MKLSTEDAFHQFGDRVFSAAFSATGSKEDADDVVQDTFLKYWDTDQDFTDENHIKAWLLRVAINRSRDLLRSFWHRKKVPWEDYMEELPFEEPEDKSLFEAVMELPRKYRVTIPSALLRRSVRFRNCGNPAYDRRNCKKPVEQRKKAPENQTDGGVG